MSVVTLPLTALWLWSGFLLSSRRLAREAEERAAALGLRGPGQGA
ncbi:hypothetical protein [Streptomyces sp. NBC_00859]|nr:hypothetical protein OG584_05365 [Streptomyces sp. NBC_00859]